MMPKKSIEIISPFGDLEPIHRMKVLGLEKFCPKEFCFYRFGGAPELPSIILINCLHLDLVKSPEFIKTLQYRSSNAVVMLLMADFYPQSIEYLRYWEKYVDVFLVPTPEMSEFIKIFTRKSVSVLIDPIDFGLLESRTPAIGNNLPLKVVWFGYPESYAKSMEIYAETLFALHRQKKIEFNIVSKNNVYGDIGGAFMHEYRTETFLDLLSQFDVAVLSHFPFDFSISTQWKSENKAVLAINRGLPVIASRTPAYQRLLQACGQDEYLFSTVGELENSLERIANPANRVKYLKMSQDKVRLQYSASEMTKIFFKIWTEVSKT